MLSRRGQSQILSVVLLGGIIIAGITSTYMWGIPLLQKNQDEAHTRQVMAQMDSLADAVTTVAQDGGSRRVDISTGNGAVLINVDNDTITYFNVARGAFVSTQEWVPMNEDDLKGVPEVGKEDEYGIRGIDKPAVLMGKAEPNGDRYATQYKIVLRKIYDPDTGQTYNIDLVSNGDTRGTGGVHGVILQKSGESVDTDGGVNGGPLERKKVLIRVS